ncbi:cobalamin synthesis protein [Candidatus Kinetoplastibacterium oncopeltii TCC290E]|uniref:Cobalamin synthesis protein n=1 Tax=Candidatus Kinetoplastidibacterium stringomonadis TCC290E TaxID=1208920 RepID=M1M9M7_9PROT|nr:GTP-binding protein [Candidatus Kinetoplastibacterium oncopeltii]AGF48655.1 cobalamin synthesis protein [Candidatus Kinetoplastibacterium oncopeltii TCC290E]
MAPYKNLNKMIPVTIITGFLGAGKTTLLKKILSKLKNYRLAIIENEFGSESIDNELLIKETKEEIIELSNGCICCNIRGDLVKTLLDLKIKQLNKLLEFDHVIIETTGVANPGPVCQTFFMDNDIADYYRLDSVVTIVDAKHGVETLKNRIEAQKQIGFADKILISKSDLVNDNEISLLKKHLIKINPRSPITKINFGDIDVDNILNINGFNLNDVLNIDSEFLKEEEHLCSETCHHNDNEIRSFVFLSNKPFDSEKLEIVLSELTEKYGSNMLRYKGILYMHDTNKRIILQGVHMLMGAEQGNEWEFTQKPNTKIVFIGHKLPKNLFIEKLNECTVDISKT